MKFNFFERKKEKLDKQKLFDEWKSKIEQMADKLNKPVDSGIKEPVILLNVMGFTTDGSCEGHLDHGLPYPWVDIEPTSKENLLKKFPDYEKDVQILTQIIKEKKYKNPQEMKRENPALYERMLPAENYISKVREETKNKMASLLNEFYSSNKPPFEDGEISANDSVVGFRLEPKASRGLGLDNWKAFNEKISLMSTEEKKEFLQKNQNEMSKFSEFLKKKFFEEK